MSAERRNLDIEGLRAIAVLGVVLHHAQHNLLYPDATWLQWLFQRLDFWSGVDLFFAISGFVITRSLIRPQGLIELPAPWHSKLAAFWIRRAWRLWPSAWLWLGLILLAVACWNHSGAFGSWHANVMATLAAVFNVANFRFADAFFRYEYGASFVYWSLSLEEQFYLLAPLLLMLLRRRAAWLMLGLILWQATLTRTPLLMSLRTDALAWGVLLGLLFDSALYQRLRPSILLRLGAWRLVVTLALWGVLAWLSAQSSTPRVTSIALVAALLVWLASYNDNLLWPGAWLRRGLAWLGARSYAIYLIHVPVFFAVREGLFRLGVTPPEWPLLMGSLLLACTLALILLLADLNYRLVEQPLRRRGQRIAQARLQRAGGQSSTAAPSSDRFMPPAASSEGSPPRE